MKKTRNTSLCSGSVIATALLLGATPSFAQTAEPSVSPFPEVATPAPLPEASPITTADPVMISSPVVQPIPEPEPEAASVVPAASNEPVAAPVTTRTAQRTNTPRAIAPVAETSPTPAAVLPTAPVEVVPFELEQPVPVVAEPAAPVADNQLTEDLVPIGLGGLAVLALAVWGFVAIGRRKPLQRRAETSVRPAPKPVQRPLPATLAASTFVAEPARNWAPVHATVHPASMAHSGAGVALPRSMPASFEERDALLKRMVAAKPDRANPFASNKARMKRARLILQSLGRDFTDVDPWIDLSQYSANWPELSRSKTVAA
ncbi:hypothetical protein [Altererythrobacter sp. Root672]|uniref:hypothetical protein n=1 Tax=Altererythrobacter sp. Root672 TaxID=1736584 RepID=UPI0006FB05D3|nr:hypothetical protein [Altererythrobacter sp. Root672]KRA83751.1 hypothetical protein ASD76_06960 [Altererythrobacter sp. Root672]